MNEKNTEHPQLHSWFMANRPADNLAWKDNALDQITFVRDDLQRALFDDGREADKWPIHVIGTHTSKSIKLPVYETRKNGLVITARNNFYDWRVSVQSDRELRFLSKPAFKTDSANSCMEGFPQERIFVSYDKSDRRSFSLATVTDYELWATVFQLRRAYEEGSA